MRSPQTKLFHTSTSSERFNELKAAKTWFKKILKRNINAQNFILHLLHPNYMLAACLMILSNQIKLYELFLFSKIDETYIIQIKISPTLWSFQKTIEQTWLQENIFEAQFSGMIPLILWDDTSHDSAQGDFRVHTKNWT